MTGTDIASWFRGRYHTRKGALAAIKERTGHATVKAIAEYTVAEYGMESIPVLMAQAKIYWDIENYPMVEKIFKQSAEFCSEHEVWKLNVAHVFFMQENKFKDAIRYYEPAVKRQAENGSVRRKTKTGTTTKREWDVRSDSG